MYLLLAILFESYHKEILDNGEEREVLHLHPFLAPYKIAVFPLMKKFHTEKAMEVYDLLKKEYMTIYDDAANIGKRYRRMDAIGTPYCVTIDENTLNSDIVTVRNRDTMEQENVKICDLISYFKDKLAF